MRRLLRAAAALAGLDLAVALARRLTATPGSEAVVAPSGPIGPPPGTPPTGQPGSSAARGLTRQQLYDQARGLDIKGRSRMSKERLSQAVAEAREGET